MKRSPAKRTIAFFIACLMVVTTCLTVSINASDYEIVEWDYLDEGTGMPDPNDQTEGLPFPNIDGIAPIISDYYFTYEPSVYAYGEDGNVDLTNPVTSVKAGDVFWFKIACTDIETEKLTKYDGFYDFEGFYTYDVEAIDRYYGGKVVSLAPGKTGILDSTWFKKFISIEKLEGMADFDVTMNWARLYTPSDPPADYLDASVNGMGQHFSLRVSGVEFGDFGIIEDGQFYFCVPLVMSADAEDGAEYTFTVPYPGIEQFADAYYWSDNMLYHDSVYGRGGSYTITVDNHDDAEANLATNATYSIAINGQPFEKYTDGYLNDLLYPLTEKSKYTVVPTSQNGIVDVGFKLQSLSEVDSLVITVNDTADTELPSVIEAYGVDADGNTVFLGDVTDGVAYYNGVTDSSNYASTVTVNAANAYQYTISGFDAGKYTDITLRIYGAASEDGYADVAVGEVEIIGEAAKVSVTIENGTIENASDDDMYYPGSVLNIVPEDVEHKTFAGWEAQNQTGSFSDDLSTFTVGNSDEVIVAVYDDVFYSIDVINGTFEDGSTFDEVTYGTILDIFADEPEEGRVFDKWLVTGDAVVDDPTSPESTVTVYGEATVTASYKDTCTLAVTNGSGSGTYNPGETAEIVADEAEEGYVFYKWEIVSGDVVIADVNSAETVAVVNSNAEVKAIYVWTYKDVPENLVNVDTPVKVEQGTIVDGADSFTKDQLYPLMSDGNWLVLTDGESVVLSYDLGAVYDVSDVVINFSRLDGFVYTDLIKVYGANNADGSDKVCLVESVVSDMTEKLAFEDGITLDANSGIYKIAVNDTEGYRYIFIEMSTDYNFTFGQNTYKNSNIAVGEVEIYGTPARYTVDVIGGEMIYNEEDYSEEDGGFLAGSVIQVVPNEVSVPGNEEFEKWIASVGNVSEENGVYTYVVNGDATVEAVFTEINKPVDDNLAPNSDVVLSAGTAVGGHDMSYVNDQLYPITANAYWEAYKASTGKNITFVFDLGDYYDVSAASITAKYADLASQTQLPNTIVFKGSNNPDGSNAVVIGSITNGLDESAYDKIEFEDFGVESNLTSVACKYDVTATDAVSCRYVVVTVTTDYVGLVNQYFPDPQIVIGEVEIYGSESTFEVTVENGTISNANPDNIYDNGTELSISADDIPHKEFIGWIVEGDGELASETEANTTFVVGSSDAKIIAQYTDKLYSLTVNNGSGDGRYAYGSSVEIIAEAHSDPEKVFDKWVLVSGDAVIEDVNNPQTNVSTKTDSVIEAVYKDRVYSLTVENGTGDGDYVKGDTAAIVADAPAAHKQFSHWEVVVGECTIADVNASSTTVVTSNVATTVRAVYTDILYDVTVNNGVVDENDYSEDGYKVDTEINITADAPEAHKQFAGWVIVEGNCSIEDASSAETVITVTGGNVVIEATYTDVEYDLVVEGGEGSGSYVFDEDVEIKATAPGENYIFDGWTVVNGEADIADADSESTVVTIIGDATIESNWIKVFDIEVINGEISSDDVKEHYFTGDSVKINADAPAEGMQFDGWVVVEGDADIADPTSLSTTVTVSDSSVVLRAEYSAIVYTLVVVNGTGSGDYEYNTEVEISADIPEGTVFQGWTVTEGNVEISAPESDTITVVIKADATITANYVEAYTIDIINGTVVLEDAQEYYLTGDEVRIVADAAPADKVFLGWVVVEGDAVIEDPDSAETTITVGTSDVVVRAEYADVLYNLEVQNGYIDNADENGYLVGSTIEIVADAAPEGYVFDKWVIVEGNGVIADEFADDTTFTIGSGNAIIKATFKPDAQTPDTGDAGLALFATLMVASLGITGVVVAKKKSR